MKSLVAILEDNQIPAVPRRFITGPAIRKPVSLPTSADRVTLTQEEREFLDNLPIFEIDGENLSEIDLPDGTVFCILVDFNTGLSWLCDTSGHDYPRYAYNINPYERVEQH